MLGGWANVMHVLKASEKLLEDTLRGDAESVAKALEEYVGEILLVGISYDKNRRISGIVA